MNDELRNCAFNGIRPYLDDCKAQSRKVCDLATYYRERRWERFLVIRPNRALTSIKPVGPNFDRWRDYYARTGNEAQVRQLDLMAKLGRDITVPGPWPPALRTETTGPPGEPSAA